MATANGQSEFWNGRAGNGWVESQALIDRLFRPLEEALCEAVAARPGARVLDIGCGTGGTTLAAARTLGGNGLCVGVDVSETMIAAARARAEGTGLEVEFVCADAAEHRFVPGSFDLMISRFGVMFFADPVAAFANLRRAGDAGAELRLLAWRGREENPFMTAAQRAAAPLLPELAPDPPGAPGQFAFAEPERVRSILTRAGWREVEITATDFKCEMPESDLLPYLSRLGPVARILQESDEPTRAQVMELVLPAFEEQFVADGRVRFTAACWTISAR